jgi:lysophospholipase L1-like esterase
MPEWFGAKGREPFIVTHIPELCFDVNKRRLSADSTHGPLLSTTTTMKPTPHLSLLLLASALCCAPNLRAQTNANPGAAAPAAKPATPAPQPPDVAAPKLAPTGEINASFAARHEAFLATAKENKAKLLFLGDSITAGWGGQKAIWESAFGKYSPANFGIGGDRTQHVLWRISNGELDGFTPKALVLMIGTNNSGSDSEEGIAAGIRKIVDFVRHKSPDTKILLLAVFPRGEKAENNAQRAKLIAVNKRISELHDDKHVFFLDIGAKFLEPNGTLTKEIMPDFLHLSAKGYQIWADAITPSLEKLMQ